MLRPQLLALSDDSRKYFSFVKEKMCLIHSVLGLGSSTQWRLVGSQIQYILKLPLKKL